MRWPFPIRHPRIKQLLQRSRQELLWLSYQLLPPHCPLCSKPLQAKPDCSIATLCNTCKAQCQSHAPSRCPRCDEPYQAASIAAHQCSQCLKTPPPFEWIKTAGIYTEVMAQAMNQLLINLALRSPHTNLTSLSPYRYIENDCARGATTSHCFSPASWAKLLILTYYHK